MSWWVAYADGTDGASGGPLTGPVWVAIITVVLTIMGQFVTTQISVDILENCKPETLKESSKNIWTNIGITAALMLTLVAAMLQADPIEAVGFSEFERDPTVGIDVQQTYITATLASFLLNLISMLMCVINMSYVEPLTEIDAVKFFLERPDTIGDPVTILIVASMMMFLALVLWVLGTYGLGVTVIMAVLGVATWIILGAQWFVNGSFNPEGLGPEGHLWTQAMKTGPNGELVPDLDKWPTSRKQSGSKLTDRMFRNRKQVQNLVLKLGKAIVEEEKKKAAEREEEQQKVPNANTKTVVQVTPVNEVNIE